MTASTSMSHETASRIVAAIRPALPQLTERVVARIRAEIPFYAGHDVVSPEDLRVSVRDNLDYILASLCGTATPNLSAPHATGRARAAQGAPLAEMLTAYRVGVAELWSAMAATARSQPGVAAGDVIDLAGAVFTVQNTYSDAALAAYRDEARDLLRMRERERAALVEVILAGTAAKGTLWEVASALRLPLDGTFLVIAAETELGRDPIPRAESALAVLDVRSVWRLDAELSLGVLSLPELNERDVAQAWDALTWDSFRNTNTAQSGIISSLSLHTNGARGTSITWANARPKISVTSSRLRNSRKRDALERSGIMTPRCGRSTSPSKECNCFEGRGHQTLV